MKKVLDVASTTVMILVLVFAFLLVGVRLFGVAPYTVLSGSMEPEYHVGSLIYVKKASVKELTVGVPITYMMENGVVVTHRIIEVLPDEDNPTVVRYRTKGDANDDPDGTLVHIENVIGRPVFTIPLLGYVAYFVQTPPGSYIVLAVIASFLLLAFLPDLLLKLWDDKKDKKGASPPEEGDPISDAKRLVEELSRVKENDPEPEGGVEDQNETGRDEPDN